MVERKKESLVNQSHESRKRRAWQVSSSIIPIRRKKCPKCDKLNVTVAKEENFKDKKCIPNLNPLQQHRNILRIDGSYRGLMYTKMYVEIRVMIDTGATNNFLVAHEVQHLGLNIKRALYAIWTVNSLDMVVQVIAIGSLRVKD